jgi:hypothetical protein
VVRFAIVAHHATSGEQITCWTLRGHGGQRAGLAGDE